MTPVEAARPITLLDLLPDHGRDDDPGRGIRFIAGAGRETVLPYAGLATVAGRIQAALRARGLRSGDEVVIALADPETFLAAFWGCLLGRMVPVPVQPPTNDEHRRKLARILALLHRPFLIADAPAEGYASASVATLLAAGLPPAPREPGAGPDDVAFVQFSSGSTGDPKGVVLTHGRVLVHLADFAASARMTCEDTFLSWFPLTHDMGLIGWHLIPLALGAWQCLMPTRLFVQRPSLWLAKASEHRASVLCTNNFGIKHFLKLLRLETVASWDLAPVRLLFNAAEPISATLCEEFSARMASSGLGRTALFPGYGLAEATLGVTFPVPGEPLRLHRVDRHRLTLGSEVRPPAQPRDEVALVELGRPMQGVALRVVDAEGRALPDSVVGAVELNSRTMTRGYHRDAARTAALFTADGWLRTGDAGFLLDGRLTLTGRIKEMLIQAGQNYWPQDLERLAEEVPGLDLGKVVACGVPDPRADHELLVMFVQLRQDPAEAAPIARALRETLLRKAGLLVDHVVPIPAVPKTTSGKIERYKLAQRFLDGEFEAARAALAAAEQAARPPAAWRQAAPPERRRLLVAALREGACLMLDTAEVALDRSLFEQGLDSRRVVAFHAWAQDALGLDLPVSLPFEQPSLLDIARYIEGEAPGLAAPAIARPAAAPIAIIGMGCRFPGGADRPERFWDLLAAGGDAIGLLPPGRGLPPSPVPGAFLPEVAGFDHGFFALSPREAEALDPQARLLLEVAWEALEDAGQDIPALTGTETGVFLGIGNTDYALAQFHGSDPEAIGPYAYTGTAPAMTAGRVAHGFGFTGPALALDSACASSLVALHLAAESLRAGECGLALAAGVNLILAPAGHASLGRLGALSPSGACRPFDDAADGYVRGEGCGVVVLRPLDAALAAGDRIHALLLGSAVNHDGRGSGLTAPNGPAQARVIGRALARAGVPPESIGYVEAHGTGTPLGDPVEARALDSVFGQGGRQGGRHATLPIGSVKGNIGHLESAAGIAGVIKTVLALRHARIPRSLNLRTPNRHLAWSEIAPRPVVEAEPWPETGTPRRAGVSAFGLAGTNAHVVLEQAPEAPVPTAAFLATETLLPLSAASRPALREAAAAWGARIAAEPEIPVARWAALAAGRRSNLVQRAVLRCTDRDGLVRGLAALAQGAPSDGLATGRRRSDRPLRLGFVYSGQGTQWLGMGAALLDADPVFRAAIEGCDALLAPLAGWSLAETLSPDLAPETLTRTDRAQAAIFAVQVGLTETLATHGIVPDCVTGHSCGEIAALWAAGVLTLPQACRVVAARGRLMQAAPGGGAMLAVQATAEVLAPLLSDAVELAAANAPGNAVLALDEADLPALTRALDGLGLSWRRLDVGFAFHSRRMAEAADALAEELAELQPAPPEKPIYSAALGRRLRAGEVDADWWRANIRAPVRFGDAIAAMAADETTHFVEIGSHPALSRAVAEAVEGAGREARTIGTLRRGQAQAAVLDACAALHVEGFDLQWDRLHPPAPAMLDDLPLYPWQRTRHWPESFEPWSPAGSRADPSLAYALHWREAAAPRVDPASGSGILVLARTGNAWAAALARHLGAALRACAPEQAGGSLADQLRHDLPRQVLVVPEGADAPGTETRAALRFLLAAIGAAARHEGAPPKLWLVTAEAPDSDAAGFGPDALWAAARCAAAEHPELGCRRVALGRDAGQASAQLLARLMADAGTAPEMSVAGGVLRLSRLGQAIPAPATRPLPVRGDARYLITGGCGSLGLAFARMLVRRGARHLVLVGRRQPSMEALAAVAALRAEGVQVTLRAADCTGVADLTALLRDAADAWPFAGLVHAAGVLEDATLAGLDPADPLAGSGDRVLAPKLDGGWAVHEATARLALDFTLLVSSAAVLLGPPGQAVYAAANGFLDALAAWRSRQGMPTLSLRLGLVAGSTMARQLSTSGLDPAVRGIQLLVEAQVDAALAEAWGSGAPTATLMRFDAERWAAASINPAMRAWCAAPLPEAPVEPTTALQRHFGTGADAEAALRHELVGIVAAVTGLAPDDLPVDRPLRELGVDSVMTLQIRDRIVTQIGCAVRITAFWAHPTVAAFARHLAESLDIATEVPPPPEAASAEPTDVMASLTDKWAKYL